MIYKKNTSLGSDRSVLEDSVLSLLYEYGQWTVSKAYCACIGYFDQYREDVDALVKTRWFILMRAFFFFSSQHNSNAIVDI